MAFLTTQVAFAKKKDKHSDHKAAQHSELKLNAGKKWETDAPLRTGMENIKKSVEEKIPEIHNGKFSQEQFADLSKKISSDLDSIFKNCKLTPEADEQLHVVLVQIIDGADKMKNAKSDERTTGAIKILQALAQYPKYFDHQGWKDIKH